MKGLNIKKLMKYVNVENVIIGILVIVLVVLLVVYVRQDNKGLDNKGVDNKGVLYFFYVDWCGYCKKAKPVISELEQDTSITSKVDIKRVNCEGSEEEQNLAKEFNVNGYPTLVFVIDGKRKELKGGVSKENIKDLIGA